MSLCQQREARANWQEERDGYLKTGRMEWSRAGGDDYRENRGSQKKDGERRGMRSNACAGLDNPENHL